MIKNNKYYLPFNNGIYSFKDKKLYNYKGNEMLKDYIKVIEFIFI